METLMSSGNSLTFECAKCVFDWKATKVFSDKVTRQQEDHTQTTALGMIVE